MFEVVVLLLIGHMRGSTGAHHLRSRLCFSNSVRHVITVKYLLFASNYGFKYSYLIFIIFINSYGFYEILLIYSYGFKYSYLILMICKKLNVVPNDFELVNNSLNCSNNVLRAKVF